MCSSISTEEKIKEAAKKVFLEKGYDGTTTRDIAQEAGLNIALMNYYFRSKEKLFKLVYEDLLDIFFNGILQIINKEIGLKEKIVEMIDHDFTIFKESPHLCSFIYSELQRNSEQLLKSIQLHAALKGTVFEKQLKEATAKGEARDIDYKHVMLLAVGNIQFLFQSKVMTMQIWNMNEAQYEAFAEKHKELIKESVINFVFSNP